MAREFRLPDIGEGLTEAEIVQWLVAVGDRVEMDAGLVEVETDKALMEIPSPIAGTVLSHGAPEGSVLAVGEILAVIGEPGDVETPQDGADEGPEAPTEPDAPAPGESAPIVGTISSEAVDLTRPRSRPVGNRPSDPSEPARPVQTLPMIRRMAADLGVDLGSIEGSGPGGRITREDVQRAADADRGAAPPGAGRALDQPSAMEDPKGDGSAEPGAEPVTVERPGSGHDSVSSGRGERMSATRRAIADHMERSWREIPHVTSFTQVDAGRLLDARRALAHRRGAPVSIDAMVVKAVGGALRSHPIVASHLEGDTIVAPDALDIGVAVDTAEGLVVVVVDDATAYDLVDLTAEISRLADAARNRKLSPERYRGQCFTVSNIGAVGGGYGTPIVPYGTSGILSVGRADEAPVVRDGAVTVAPMMPLSFSYDHRIIDGAEGRRFLATLTENLEEPALFLG